MDESGRVRRPYRRLVAGVQLNATLIPLTVVDKSKNAPMVRGTCSMNSGHYLRPETLAGGPLPRGVNETIRIGGCRNDLGPDTSPEGFAFPEIQLTGSASR